MSPRLRTWKLQLGVSVSHFLVELVTDNGEDICMFIFSFRQRKAATVVLKQRVLL